MGDLRWRGPMGRVATGVTAILLVVILVPFIVLTLSCGASAEMVLAEVLFLAAAVGGHAYARKTDGDIWSSVLASLPVPLHELVPRLEEELAGEGLSFTTRGWTEEATRWDELIHVGGLTLHLADKHPLTVVYLGPVGKDNREDVERLKRLVDRALG